MKHELGAQHETQPIGSDFDDFLKKEGILDDARAVGIKRVVVHQLEQGMKTRLSRSEQIAFVTALLEPPRPSIRLRRAAAAYRKKMGP